MGDTCWGTMLRAGTPEGFLSLIARLQVSVNLVDSVLACAEWLWSDYLGIGN